MHPFEGFLEHTLRDEGKILARFVVGGFDPFPTSPPVLLLQVDDPHDADAVYAELCRVMKDDSGAYVSVVSGTEAHIVTDHGTEITLSGKAVTQTPGQYEARDFERLAKQNYEWGQSQHKASRELFERLTILQNLLREQSSRVMVKIQSHAPGSTAHTLYEQHLAFISRALSESRA